MTDSPAYKAANLAFFNTAIVQPVQSLRPTIALPLMVFPELEAAHLASLGAQIGYFDPRQAYNLTSSFSNLSWITYDFDGLEALRADNPWSNIVKKTRGGHLIINEEQFFSTAVLDARTKKMLHSAFQVCLLLINENIFEDDSQHFLNSVGWTDENQWALLRFGGGAGIATAIRRGFANAFSYWEELDKWWHSEVLSALSRSVYQSFATILGNPAFETEWSDDSAFWSLINFVRAILAPHLNLTETHLDPAIRCFSLAGESIGRVFTETPEWFDARSRIFQRLQRLLFMASGVKFQDHQIQSWEAYTEAIERYTQNRTNISDFRNIDSP